MKIGFNMLLWTPFVTEEHFGLFEKLKAVGYDGVELEVIDGAVDDYARVGRVLKDLDMECTAVTIMPDADRNPLSPDAGRRKAALDHLTWAIECSVAAGAKLLAGPYYQPLGQFTGVGPTEDEKSRAADVHRQAAETAARAGVVMAVESLNRFECYFLNTLTDAADHVRRVDHPNLGLMYDSFHANIEEKDPIGCITQHMDLLRHVHISSNDRGTPGRGSIPWGEIFAALRRGGYDEWLTIESFGQSMPELAATTCVWRKLAGSEEEVYTEGYQLIQQGWAAAG